MMLRLSIGLMRLKTTFSFHHRYDNIAVHVLTSTVEFCHFIFALESQPSSNLNNKCESSPAGNSENKVPCIDGI